MSTIFALIDAGDTHAVAELLAREPEQAAARDEQGLSALMHAAYRGGGPLLDAVRAAEPPLDPWDRILVGESDGLPAPDAWSPDGFTPLHIAAFSHNVGAAATLLDEGADPDTIALSAFATVTALGTAATFGAVDVARLLLERGADTEATADHGFTPLQSAASNGSVELVDLLLAHGAQPDARNERGQTAADVAANDDVRALLGG